MSYFCSVGWHRWCKMYIDYKHDHDLIGEYHLNQPTRTCLYCGRCEVLDVHCLGLNPAKYLYTWRLRELTKFEEVINALQIHNYQQYPKIKAEVDKIKLS